MIGCFPTLADDEILFSIVARHADRMQYHDMQMVVKELFGTATHSAVVDLPSRLTQFVAALPPGHPYTVNDIVDRHTMLPFYQPFLPLGRVEQVRERMAGDTGSAIHVSAGINASSVPIPSYLRFCPRCVEIDRAEVGECYWHRLHQAPGVHVCPIHCCWLENSDIAMRTRPSKILFVSAERAVRPITPRLIDPRNRTHQILLRLAEDVDWLLRHTITTAQLEHLRARYRQLLARHGLATYRGTVHTRTLLTAFIAFYPDDLWAKLNVNFDAMNDKGWLARLVRAPLLAMHPLYHLLLMQFLEYRPDAFFALPIETAPFGNGPWPCLNPACPAYRVTAIQDCDISYRLDLGGRPTGVFACSCGYTYTRTGPDTAPDDVYRKTRIVAYGAVWEQALRVGWDDPQLTLVGLARQLNTDVATIKRNAARLNLSFDRPHSIVPPLRTQVPLGPQSGSRADSSRIADAQTEWHAAFAADPGARLIALRAEHPSAYAVLARHAPQWLKEYTFHHALRGSKQSDPSMHERWSTRDLELARSVVPAVRAILSLPGSPVRITRSRIAIEMNSRWLIQNQLNRLPKTARVLNKVVETNETFAIRRIRYVATITAEQGQPLSRAKLLDRANAWPYAHDIRVAVVIECVLGIT